MRGTFWKGTRWMFEPRERQNIKRNSKAARTRDILHTIETSNALEPCLMSNMSMAAWHPNFSANYLCTCPSVSELWPCVNLKHIWGWTPYFCNVSNWGYYVDHKRGRVVPDSHHTLSAQLSYTTNDLGNMLYATRFYIILPLVFSDPFTLPCMWQQLAGKLFINIHQKILHDTRRVGKTLRYRDSGRTLMKNSLTIVEWQKHTRAYHDQVFTADYIFFSGAPMYHLCRLLTHTHTRTHTQTQRETDTHTSLRAWILQTQKQNSREEEKIGKKKRKYFDGGERGLTREGYHTEALKCKQTG